MTTTADLKATRTRLGLNKKDMARRLELTPEWYGMLERGKKPLSKDIRLRLEHLIRHQLESSSSISRLEESQASFGVVKSLLNTPKEPSNRGDCERYFQRLLDAAEESDNPNAYPVIYDRLQKKFPLDEWGNQNLP